MNIITRIGLLTVDETTLNICSDLPGIQCPILPGMVDIAYTPTIPSFFPSGVTVTQEVRAKNSNGSQLFAVRYTIQFKRQ